MILQTKLQAILLAVSVLIIPSAGAYCQKKAEVFSTISPSRFTENKGQVTDQNGRPRPDVKYMYNAPGLKVIFKENSFSYELYTVEKQSKVSEASGKPDHGSLPDKLKAPDPVKVHTHRIDITLPGAARKPQIIAEGKSRDYTNYFLAHTPEEGAQHVHGYTRLTYKDIWPKVDLVFYARKEGELKYDIVLRPGARLSDVKFAYAGMKGLNLEKGKLKIKTALGEAEESVPLSYLQGCGARVEVSAQLKGSLVRYQADAWDRKKTLVIDPVLKWGTYYGGNTIEQVFGIAADGGVNGSETENNVFISGYTLSPFRIATAGAHQTKKYESWGLPGEPVLDAFLAKFNSSGHLLWATYYGGEGNESINGVATDASGNCFVTGYTSSKWADGFSTNGAYQRSYGGGGVDGFVAKFNGAGIRQWGTYYGGQDMDEFNDIAIDATGNLIVTGSTRSNKNIATADAFQPELRGLSNAFLVKFNSSGIRLWGTYYGGGSYDLGLAVTTDNSGNILLTGSTSASDNLSTPDAHQVEIAGKDDAFIAKFSSTGERLWATYFGGKEIDNGLDIATDAAGNVFVAGEAYSNTGISTPDAYKTKKGNGFPDGYLVKFSSTGKLRWGTYYGGGIHDHVNSIAVDAYGNALIAGRTESTNLIATSDALQSTRVGKLDGFAAKFNSSGKRIWGTYYGGLLHDEFRGIAIDGSGHILITGYTESDSGISTSGGYQDSFAGVCDAFVLRLYDEPTINDIEDTTTNIIVQNTIRKPSIFVYPNPFSDNVGIRFALAKADNVRMELLDVAGRILTVQELGLLPAGEQNADISSFTEALLPGVYLVRLQAGEQCVTQRIVKAAGGG